MGKCQRDGHSCVLFTAYREPWKQLIEGYVGPYLGFCNDQPPHDCAFPQVWDYPKPVVVVPPSKSPTAVLRNNTGANSNGTLQNGNGTDIAQENSASTSYPSWALLAISVVTIVACGMMPL